MGSVDNEEEFGLVLDAGGQLTVDEPSEGVRWHGVHDDRSNELLPTDKRCENPGRTRPGYVDGMRPQSVWE